MWLSRRKRLANALSQKMGESIGFCGTLVLLVGNCSGV